MFVAAIEAEANALIAHTIIESVTFGIGVIGYMVDVPAMLI